MGDNGISNPQRVAFKENYCNPESETFGNALQSALRAGYSQEYSESITSQGTEWFSEILRDTKMLNKAEKVLDDMLEMETETEQEDKDGHSYVRRDASLVKIKQDTAKFVNERLNKKKWSSRTELTGAEGKELPQPIMYVQRDDSNQEDSQTEEEN